MFHSISVFSRLPRGDNYSSSIHAADAELELLPPATAGCDETLARFRTGRRCFEWASFY